MKNNFSERGFTAILGILVILIVLVAVGVGIYLLNKPTTLKSHANGASINLSYPESPGTKNVGDTVDLKLGLSTQGENVVGIDAVINYDPNLIIRSGGLRDIPAGWSLVRNDSPQGQVVISLIAYDKNSKTLAPPINGGSIVLTIPFKILKDPGNHQIPVNFDPAGTRLANTLGTNVLSDSQNVTIALTPPPAIPFTVSAAAPSCNNGSLNTTISWTGGNPSNTYVRGTGWVGQGFTVDIIDSSLPTASHQWYNKGLADANSSGQTDVSNFIFWDTATFDVPNTPPLSLAPNHDYSARVYSDASGTSNTVNFHTPACSVAAPPPQMQHFSIKSDFSGNQGQKNWYYYYADQNGAIRPATFGTDQSSQYHNPPTAWVAGPDSWMYVSGAENIGGDTEKPIIYWKAPSNGTAVMTVTETKPSWVVNSGSNGFKMTLGSAPDILYNPNVAQETVVKDSDPGPFQLTTSKHLTAGQVMIYMKDSLGSAYHDDENYTLTVDFTPD